MVLAVGFMALGCGFVRGLVGLVEEEIADGDDVGPSPDLGVEVIFVSASTAVPDIPGYSFQPRMLHDGNISTCWQENNKDSAGQGETITVYFARPVHLTQIRIANGCQNQSAGKYGDLYSTNSRPRSLQISSRGALGATVDWSLQDRVGWQSLDVSMNDVEEVTFRILDVYRGTRWQDASVSEIAFSGKPTGREASTPSLTTGRYCYRGSDSGVHLVGEVNITGRHARWMLGEAETDNVIFGEGVVTTTGVMGMATYMLDVDKLEHSQDGLTVDADHLVARVVIDRVSCQAIGSY